MQIEMGSCMPISRLPEATSKTKKTIEFRSTLPPLPSSRPQAPQGAPGNKSFLSRPYNRVEVPRPSGSCKNSNLAKKSRAQHSRPQTLGFACHLGPPMHQTSKSSRSAARILSLLQKLKAPLLHHTPGPGLCLVLGPLITDCLA